MIVYLLNKLFYNWYLSTKLQNFSQKFRNIKYKRINTFHHSIIQSFRIMFSHWDLMCRDNLYRQTVLRENRRETFLTGPCRDANKLGNVSQVNLAPGIRNQMEHTIETYVTAMCKIEPGPALSAVQLNRMESAARDPPNTSHGFSVNSRFSAHVTKRVAREGRGTPTYSNSTISMGNFKTYNSNWHLRFA